MRKIIRTVKFWAFLVIFFSLITSAMAVEQTNSANDNLNVPVSESAQALHQQGLEKIDVIPLPTVTPNAPKESMSILDRLKAFIDLIKFEIKSITNISIAPKIMAIINTIELQCKNLVDLVMSAPKPSDSAKINEINKNIESQRQALSGLISSQSESNQDSQLNSYLVKIDGSNTKDSTMKIYAK